LSLYLSALDFSDIVRPLGLASYLIAFSTDLTRNVFPSAS
jgi:hypothetical protein